MRTPLRRVLSVYEGIILLPILTAVCQRDFDIMTLEVDDRIPQFFPCGLLFQQVKQSIARKKFPTIVVDRKTRIEEGIIPHQIIQVFGNEVIVFEHRLVRSELHQRTVLLLRFRDLRVGDQNTLLELRRLRLSVAERLNFEVRG